MGEEMTHEEMIDEASRRENENQGSGAEETVQQGGGVLGGDLNSDQSKTQRAFDENASQLNDKWHQSSTYVEIPDSVNLPDFMLTGLKFMIGLIVNVKVLRQITKLHIWTAT